MILCSVSFEQDGVVCLWCLTHTIVQSKSIHRVSQNAKSLKSQAPQGFSGCLDIENDEMNKKNFLSASPRVNQTLRSL